MAINAATPPPTAPPMTAPLALLEPFGLVLPVAVGITRVAVRVEAIVYFLVK